MGASTASEPSGGAKGDRTTMRRFPRTILSLILAAALLMGLVPVAAVADTLDKTAYEELYAHHPRRPIDQEAAAAEIQADSTGATAFGIDVSLWQGTIDWDTVQPQIDFAIIRCGYGGNETDQDDVQWKANADACTRLGIPFGVYIYSYARTDAQALSEAEHVLRQLEGYEPTLPIFLDLEDDSILNKCSKSDILRHATIFCNAIEAAGYEAGIYANTYWWADILTADDYDQWYRWVARYASSLNYDKEYLMWQYSQTGTIKGIKEKVDLNYWYGEFPPNSHTHEYTTAVTAEPTCTEDGILTYTCECGDTYTEAIPAPGHSYEPAVTDPTCTEAGFTTHTCTVCGDVLTDTPTDPLGHDFDAGFCLRCGGMDPNYDHTPMDVAVGTADARPGDEVTIPVTVTGNDGFSAFSLTVEADAALELTGVTPGALLGDSGTFTADTTTVTWSSDADILGNGTLFDLTFRVRDEATDGSYGISVGLQDGLASNFVSADGIHKNVVFAPGAVAVDAIDVIASGLSGDVAWTVTEDGLLTFSGSGKMEDYTSNTAMPWLGYDQQITAVVLEEGVASIGDYAFYGMGIESIAIPETVTSIGDYAFKNCPALDGVVLPEGLTALGDSAFYACASLTSVDIPASLWTVKPYTFKNCTALETVTFHEGNLQKISDGAFYNTALTAVTFPDCLDIIDVYSFKNCSDLASVTLGSGITQIRDAVFYGSAISEIVIPEGVTTVKPYAFKNCVNLRSVELPESLTTVGEAAFYACTALETLDLPDSVASIGNYAFRKCTGLNAVSFGSGLETIGESSFYGCTGLTELAIPDAVTAIGPYAFKSCSGVTSLTLGGGLETLGASAFHSCTGLTEVILPARVTAIGEYCFSGSTGIGVFRFQGDAPAIGSGAFNRITATAFYPGDNATWTDEILTNYGGTITWTAN